MGLFFLPPSHSISPYHVFHDYLDISYFEAGMALIGMICATSLDYSSSTTMSFFLGGICFTQQQLTA